MIPLLRFAAAFLYHMADPLLWLAAKLSPPLTAKQAIQAYYDGAQPWQLPPGIRGEIWRVAWIHAYAIQGAITALEDTHRQVLDTHNAVMTERPPTETQHYLNLGYAHGITVVGESCVAIRDWVVGRLGP